MLVPMGAFVGWIAGTVLGIRRGHVERAMRRAGIAQSRASSLAASMYASLGASLVETLWLASHPEIRATTFAALDEWSCAQLEAARGQGRGVVIATAHTGNWEVAAAAIAEAHPLTAVVKPMHVAWVDRFCHGARLARKISLAAPEQAMGRARAALRRGEAVAMVIDQVPDRARHAVVTEFLCGRVDVDRSPATLAAAMRAPLVVAVSRRVGALQRMEVLSVHEPPKRRRREWVDTATQDATRSLDRWVHAHPSEWLWMHRRWKAARP